MINNRTCYSHSSLPLGPQQHLVGVSHCGDGKYENGSHPRPIQARMLQGGILRSRLQLGSAVAHVPLQPHRFSK
jgi:hypothetical protein